MENKNRKTIKSNFASKFAQLLSDETGSAVLEVVIVIAIVLAIALIFNNEIRMFANSLFDKAFDISRLDGIFQ